MASFFQRVFSRVFIVLQRQPEENESEDQKSSLEESAASEQNIEKDVSKGSVMPKYRTSVKISDSETLEIDLVTLYSDLKSNNNLEMRCKSALNLAMCLAYDSHDIEVTDCLGVLTNLCDSYNYPELTVCHALLLCAFTKMSMSLKELEMLEERIVSLAVSLKRRSNINEQKKCRTSVLIENYNERTVQLCQKLFSESYLDMWEIDIPTICCCSLNNLSLLVKQHENEFGAKYIYKNSTIKYIFGMTGKSTQEIVSEFMGSQKQSSPSISSHRVKQCLHVLEHALFINPDLSSCESIQHESFSLPHCLTRLLGWSVSSVFPGKDQETEDTDSEIFKFHLSTLLCILKILSILTFNPYQYDSFTNVKGLMEKILMCTLKAYFESDSNHFDIQILCLEMLINLYIKNQKTFVLLCLKKFKISDSEQVLAVEALLKMLSDNLEKIKEVKESTPYPQNKTESNLNEVSQNKSVNETSDTNKNLAKESPEHSSNQNSEAKEEKLSKDAANANSVKNTESSSREDSAKKSEKDAVVDTDPVLLAASKDMEHSTIVSFICVLIVFFMRTKQSFKDFILSKLTSEALKEATDVSKKFLEFASLTGGMPVTGILILTQTINKLQAIQTS